MNPTVGYRGRSLGEATRAVLVWAAFPDREKNHKRLEECYAVPLFQSMFTFALLFVVLCFKSRCRFCLQGALISTVGGVTCIRQKNKNPLGGVIMFQQKDHFRLNCVFNF